MLDSAGSLVRESIYANRARQTYGTASGRGIRTLPWRAGAVLERWDGLIDVLDSELQDWIRSKLREVDVSLDPPGDHGDGRGVSLYLLDVTPKPSARGERRAPLQLRVRYLVTTWAKDPAAAHRDLGELVFSAMQEPRFEVDPLPVPTQTWMAFGLAPRPSFVLAATAQKELPEPDTKLVTEPVFVPAPFSSLHGLVMTPDDIPVPRARVELPSLQASAVTDSRGRFRFVRVPTEPPTKVILVTAKGRKERYEADAVASEEDPLLLRFDPREA